YKYGVKITTIEKIKYKINADGSREKISSTTETKYDYSTFNATGADLKPEAMQLANMETVRINGVFQHVNEYRNELGLDALYLDTTLNTLATIRALEMAYTNTMSHTRPNGKICFTIFDEMGAKFGTMSGENVAKGYKTADGVSLGWKNSAEHYANIINSSFTRIGVGVACVNNECYWAQLFGN
ncbi:MAG: CAP domain-containing protein, partial [Bacilli bacterium]|nr:CAP domain-containing protein [Bacilli bacterium]